MESLIEDMKRTHQTSGVNMLQHGEMVRDEYRKLIKNLPNYILDVRSQVLSQEITDRYQVFHDCGKPYCKVDNSYPDHAAVSAKTWLSHNPEDHIVAELMARDMDAHTGEFDWSSPLAPTLYLTAWAELFANATMFGGIESTSFKIKKKRLIKVGRKLNSKEKSDE